MSTGGGQEVSWGIDHTFGGFLWESEGVQVYEPVLKKHNEMTSSEELQPITGYPGDSLIYQRSQRST